MTVITVNPVYDPVAGSSSFELPAATPADAVLLLFFNGQVLRRNDFTRDVQNIVVDADLSADVVEVLILSSNSETTGDFVTKDSMRTFSSFMMLGIQTAFGVQCNEADNLLAMQTEANELQTQIDALKASAAARDVESSPEYLQLIAQNKSLLDSLEALRNNSITVTETPMPGEYLDTEETTADEFYVSDFWQGVTDASITIEENTSVDSLLESSND